MSAEGFPQSNVDNQELSVEATANYEGNASEVQFGRFNTPAIRNQIIDLMYQAELAHANFIKTEKWVKYIPTGGSEDDWLLFKGETSGKIMGREALKFVPKSREEIEKEVEESILEVERVTPIEISNHQPDVSRMTTQWEMPGTSKRPTVHQMSIIEAHEKGHQVRTYHRSFYNQIFQKGFDQSKVEYTESDFEMDRIEWGKVNDKENPDYELTFERAKEEFFEYLFSAIELAERMGQLKNYFGMKADEKFTKAHLDYAREHYVEDTGMDNRMTHFFQAITPETEEIFLELINSTGI